VLHLDFEPNEYYDNSKSVKHAYEFINDTLCREYGVFTLVPDGYQEKSKYNRLVSFLLSDTSTEQGLDVVELSFKVIDNFVRKYNYKHSSTSNDDADKAIAELNDRFKEHGIGYQFHDGELIRIDSQLIHKEAVIPALRLLSREEFAGAHQEFLGAYEHYRHGKHKEALNDALKSFESTMKSICSLRGWKYEHTATSKVLIDICFKNKLIPEFWQSHMNSLRSLLEGSVPTARNKLSGHGQGVEEIIVPEHLVAYILHMTASTIVFLVEAERGM